MSIVLFQPGAQLPAYMQDRAALKAMSSVLNADVITGPTYPVLSIKGKVFTLVKGNDKKVLTKPDDPDEVLQFLNLTVVRANTKSRVFFAKAYVEGSEGAEARPDCYSVDSITPAPDAKDRQAPKCAVCPHAVWGSRANMEGKGTACSVNTRTAVIDPTTISADATDKLEPYLLRIPAASRSNFADVVKAAEQRNIPYNALVLKVGFDKDAPSPKLTFKLIGLVGDEAYKRIGDAYNEETVQDMLGFGEHRQAPLALAPTEADADMARLLAEKKQAEEAEAARAAEAAAAVERARQASQVVPPAAANAAQDLGDLDALMAGGVAQTPASVTAPAATPSATAQPVATVMPEAVAPPPARRRRRTPAEMEAARAAGTVAAETGVITPQQPAAVVAATPTVAATPVVAAPPAAVVTPPPPAAVVAVTPPVSDAHANLLGDLDALLEATDD